MAQALIFDAVRTPRGRGRPDGALHGVRPIDLAATCLAAIRDRNALETGRVEDVILGVATPIGEQGGDIARFAALRAGYDQSVAGLQVHRFCASGLDACNLAAARAAITPDRLFVAGGVESMSRVRMGSDGGAMTDDDRVTAACHYVPQGISGDLVASLYNISRDDVDAYAALSQARAATARREGRFDRSIVPVRNDDGVILLDSDEHPRPGTTAEGLVRLQPAFAQMGADGYDRIALSRYPDARPLRHVHHGGNSAGIVDGAAALLIGSAEAGKAAGLRPRARILAQASAAGDPCIMLTAPDEAARKALARAGLTAGEIDIWEVNEAFASVPLWFLQAMDIDPEMMNVNGGAIALGHPLGATGAILLGTALDELERSCRSRALITLCAAGGQAAATIIERV
jgi:acetyl-CoA C-acetyltransferase